MKATDLMVGDWVRINYRNKVVQVTEIVDKAIGTTAISPLSEDEFEPIPLAPEILEKNGFIKWQVDYILDIDETQYLDYYPHEASLERIYIHKDGSREVVFRVNAISYVHLLQHALRLCGIEKEIKL